MSESIRVLIVDDHLALRVGFAAILAESPGIEVVGEASDNKGAIEACTALSPDVVSMDLRIPGGGGVEATVAIRKRVPTARVLIITTFDADEDVYRAIQAGASGYLLKGLSSGELVSAIKSVHRGDTIMPPDIAVRLRDRGLRKDLSPRELEALRLMVAGRSNREIAQQLSIGEESVKTHLKSLFLKLGVADRTQAVIVAIRQGIVHL